MVSLVCLIYSSSVSQNSISERLAALGVGPQPHTMAEVWRLVCTRNRLLEGSGGEALAALMKRAPLARRLLERAGAQPSRAALRDVYRQLCFSLEKNSFF